jgi:hypothetical protein
MSSIGASQFNHYDVEKWKEYLKGKDRLSLEALGLTDKAVIALSQVLKENITIRSMDLSCNKITQVGASAIADALRINKHLAIDDVSAARVDLSANPIAKEGCFAIAKALDETQRIGYTIYMNFVGLNHQDVEWLNKTPEVIRVRNSLHKSIQIC